MWKEWRRYRKKQSVVVTTHRNGTRSLLTSAKLSIGYLVVGITRELDKEPSLYYPLYIYMAPGPYYNNIYLALKSMRHTFNLRCTCAYYVYTMRNPCLLTSLLILTPSRLFLILPDHSRLLSHDFLVMGSSSVVD